MDVTRILRGAVLIGMDTKVAVQVAPDVRRRPKAGNNPALFTRPGTGPKNNAAAVVQSVPLDIRTVDVKSLISSNIDNFIDCHIMHPFFCICCLLDLQVFSGGKDCNSSLII